MKQKLTVKQLLNRISDVSIGQIENSKELRETREALIEIAGESELGNHTLIENSDEIIKIIEDAKNAVV